MGARCSVGEETEHVRSLPSASQRPKNRSSSVAEAQAKDTRFWYEKMRFSKASQDIYTASVRGDADLATRALRSLGDPNCCTERGYRPLQVAISCGNYDLLELLLKAGADINCQAEGSPPPAVLAASAGDVRVFERLVAGGADLAAPSRTPPGDTPLTRASKLGHERIVLAALSQGSPGFQKLLAQQARFSDGATSLHLAAEGNHRAVCDRLLGAGAEPSVVDKRGRSPLHSAVESNYVETAQLLLTFGAAPSACDRGGVTPVHIAAQRGHLSAADLLLRFMADVNARRADGRTPLHLACEGGWCEMCRLLLAQGAEPNIEDEANDAPFDLCFREGHVKCCRTLLVAGARVEVLPLAEGTSWVPPYTELEPRDHEEMHAKAAKVSRTGLTKGSWAQRDDMDESYRDLVGC